MQGKVGRIVLGAMASGSGKTLITCGLLQALLNKGYRLSSFKCGPDYIDPMFHSHVLGTKTRNLDSFLTDEGTVKYLLGENGKGGDISIIEGVMGYYDGLGGISTKGSTYDIARITKSPVILIVNAKGASLSLIPAIKGFMEYREDSYIKGIILNQISPMFYETIKAKIEEELGIKVFGYVPKLEHLAIEGRHLGLISPSEIKNLKNKIDELANVLLETLQIDEIIKTAQEAPELSWEEEEDSKEKYPVTIGVAKDEAFSFHYEDNYALLNKLGAKIIFFSPLSDKKLPNVDGLWLVGGYPEQYGNELTQNKSMRDSIKAAVEGGMPCIAECGGFMYINSSLEGMDGIDYPMVGLIQGRAYRCKTLRRFGYIELESKKDSILGKTGTKLNAHEFHYYDTEDTGEDFKAVKPINKRSYDCIHSKNNLLAGYPHIYLYSNKEMGSNFLKACNNYKGRQKDGIK